MKLSDFPPPFIYASISMTSQDELNVVNNDSNIDNMLRRPSMTGGLDSFPYSEQDEEKSTREVHTEVPKETGMMDFDHYDDDDAVSCPPHVIAEEDEDVSEGDVDAFSLR